MRLSSPHFATAGEGLLTGTVAHAHDAKEAPVQTRRASRPISLVIACLFGIVAIASWDRPLVAAALVVVGPLALIPWWLAGGVAPDPR
jgi:hypothetical protein